MLLSHYCLFFFTDTPTTDIYTLSLHDALPILRRISGRPISAVGSSPLSLSSNAMPSDSDLAAPAQSSGSRSEEHTSELQSRPHLVCRLLLEKKKPIRNFHRTDENTLRTLLLRL